MKCLSSIAVCLLFLLVVTSTRAQESLDATINNLQRQIQVREAIDRDPGTPSDLRAANRRTLAHKRAQLLEAVNTRIAQLEKYRDTLGSSATPEETQYVETSLRDLNRLKSELGAGQPPNQAVVSPVALMRPKVAQVSSSTSSNVNGVARPNGTAQGLVMLERTKPGDSMIKGTSVSGVSEVLVEIRSSNPSDGNGNNFSSRQAHSNQTRTGSGSMTYRVTRFAPPGSDEADWNFRIRLSQPLMADDQVRAVPDGDAARGTGWLAVVDRDVTAGNASMVVDVPDANPQRRQDRRPDRREDQDENRRDDDDDAPFEIISPWEHSTPLDKIAVEIRLKRALPASVTYAVKVENAGQNVDKGEITIKAYQRRGEPLPVKLKPGQNRITISDKGDNSPELSRWVYISSTAAAAPPAPAGPAPAATQNGVIHIKTPAKKENVSPVYENATFIPVKVSVDRKGDNNVKRIYVRVLNNGKIIPQDPDTLTVDYSDKKDDAGTKETKVRIGKGANKITVFDADADLEDSKTDQDTISVQCDGDDCGADVRNSTITTNSRFTRAILGIEQAGGSSAESKTNPFLDFFFTTPIAFSKRSSGEPKPKFGLWSQLRFSTTPEQTSSFAVFSSNFVNQATDPTKVVELVKSFDFLAGAEYRLGDSNGWIWTLIPGVKQRTSIYLTAAGGAISPLSVKRESAQLFVVPPSGDPRRPEFVRRFGDPGSLKYVGFVPLERDRFFRQYYYGVRLKTHYCEDSECREFKNRFPSIIDIAFGQNEAVTGGRFKSDVRDASNNFIKRRRAWVARLDAFFPLPLKEASFLYLYGTALMKIGGGGVKIENPLFLDTPASTVQITDPGVYLPSPDLQPTRVDRDYYKIGIGVNLTDLFNKPPKKTQ